MQIARIRGSGARLRRISALALLVAAVLGLECEDDGPLDGEDPEAGEIFGRVRVDDVPRSGVTVRLALGTTELETTATDESGAYEFTGLDPGTYTVSIATIPDAECPGNRGAIVMARDRIEVNFSCESPDPPPGVVSGLVTVDGVPTGGFTVVLIRDPDGTVAAQGTVAADGSFGFENIPSGAYIVQLLLPDGSGVTCPTSEQGLLVAAGMTTTVVFACS